MLTRYNINGKIYIEKGGVFIKRTWNKKYRLLDIIDAKTVDIGTFKELSENNGIDIDKIKWSYYHKVIIEKRYLVKEKIENE